MDAKTNPESQPSVDPTTPQPIHQANGIHKDQHQQHPGQHMVHPTPLHLLGEAPAIIDCPYCSFRGPTRVDSHSSSMTIVAGIGIGIICICAACLPCLLHWFEDVDHFCSHCNQRVAFVPHSGIAQVIQPQNVPQGYNMGSQPQYGAHAQQQQQPQQYQSPQNQSSPPQYG